MCKFLMAFIIFKAAVAYVQAASGVQGLLDLCKHTTANYFFLSCFPESVASSLETFSPSPNLGEVFFIEIVFFLYWSISRAGTASLTA